MSQQFKEQGGAATMDPNPILRWLTSKMMTTMSSEARLLKNRQKAEAERSKNGAAHEVEYFHQVDDGYSHLSAQILERFSTRYQIALKCHLVSEAEGDNAPEPDLLLSLSRYDAFHIAPYYGLTFSQHDAPVAKELADKASAIFANQLDKEGSVEPCVTNIAAISTALWAGDSIKLDDLASELGESSSERRIDLIEAGNARRAELKHYSSAMFYYAGEWYWGVDRLYHLEQRLIELGLDSTPGEPLIAPRPKIDTGPLKDKGELTLEIYPSLRSPYTAVVFDQTLTLAEQTGVNLNVRPVLPMVMRGVPATREKGMYILFDTGREARAAGVPFGPCYDPIGEPARRAYSLLSWAKKEGKANELFSSFIKCAWVDAVNTNNNRGMKKVVERAGLDWQVAKQVIDNDEWQEELEVNRLSMYELGLWGVPSFRLLDSNGHTIVALWGQDRLWIIAKEIQRHLQSKLQT